MKPVRGFALVVILVIFALVIVIVGSVIYFDLNKKPISSLLPTTINRSLNLAQPSPSPADETTNWKIYTSQAFSFQFNYPSSLLIDDARINDLGILFYTKESKEKTDKCQAERLSGSISRATECGYQKIILWPRKNIKQESLEKEAVKAFGPHQSFEKTVIGGKPAFKSETNGPPLDKGYLLSVDLGDSILNISAFATTDEGNFPKTLDQILSTFRFLD